MELLNSSVALINRLINKLSSRITQLINRILPLTNRIMTLVSSIMKMWRDARGSLWSYHSTKKTWRYIAFAFVFIVFSGSRGLQNVIWRHVDTSWAGLAPRKYSFHYLCEALGTRIDIPNRKRRQTLFCFCFEFTQTFVGETSAEEQLRNRLCANKLRAELFVSIWVGLYYSQGLLTDHLHWITF